MSDHFNTDIPDWKDVKFEVYNKDGSFLEGWCKGKFQTMLALSQAPTSNNTITRFTCHEVQVEDHDCLVERIVEALRYCHGIPIEKLRLLAKAANDEG